MQQINPNLKTLGQLIPINNFCDWFMNSNSNLLTNGASPINFYVSQNLSLNGTPSYYYNCPAFSIYFSNLNLFNNLNNNWVALFPNLLGFIYQLFQNAIPYDQSTTTYTIVPSTSTTPITLEVPNVLVQIASYFGTYQNRILEYMVVQLKYMAQITVMNGGFTNTYQYNTYNGSTSQNNNYDVNSFNPVETTSSIEINPINVTNANYNTGIYSPGSVTSGEPNINITGATYNNHAGATASNSNQWATNNAVNLQNFATVGTGDGMTILRPVIKKISSLFWAFGNDYYPDNINWGFNIW